MLRMRSEVSVDSWGVAYVLDVWLTVAGSGFVGFAVGGWYGWSYCS